MNNKIIAFLACFFGLITGTAVNAQAINSNGTASVPGAKLFSQLAVCGSSSEGATQAISDSTTAVLGATIAGSGSNHVSAYCNGSVWIVGTVSGPGITSPSTIQATSDGVHAGGAFLTGNTTVPSSLPSNSFGFIGPNSASFTSWFARVSSTPPLKGQYLWCGAPASNVADCSFGNESTDYSIVNLVDEFFGLSNASTYAGFAAYNITGTGKSNTTQVASAAGHPGILRLPTSAASGDGSGMALFDSQAGYLGNSTSLSTGGDYSAWEVNIIFRTDATATNYGMFAGFSNANTSFAYGAANAIGMYSDTTSHTCTAGLTAGSTVNFVFVVRASSSDTCADSGVAVASSTWYRLRIVSTTLGTVGFQLATSGGSYTTLQNLSTNVPTGNLGPQLQVITRTTSVKNLDLDRWSFTGLGVSR